MYGVEISGLDDAGSGFLLSGSNFEDEDEHEDEKTWFREDETVSFLPDLQRFRLLVEKTFEAGEWEPGIIL